MVMMPTAGRAGLIWRAAGHHRKTGSRTGVREENRREEERERERERRVAKGNGVIRKSI